MLFLGKRPDQVSASDFQWLVENGIHEGDRLEYKRDMYGRDDESRRELLRDVTALANHRGGHLLIGIDEDDEGAAREVVGIEPDDHAAWIRSLTLSSVDERIIGLSVYEVDLPSGRVVL